MNILLTGATGLIGRALCSALRDKGHSLTVLSRRPNRVAQLCSGARGINSLDQYTSTCTYDAVINLAGAPIIGARWSARRKRTLTESRVALTAKLVDCITRAQHKPQVLLSGSAVGYYGDCGARIVAESAPAGTDFGARLCADWERQAHRASQHGVRVCLLRTGLVLSREGGLLAKMRPTFALGLGAQLGDGAQWMSWIHLRDEVDIILKLLTEPHHGAFNLCAPNAVTNAAFTRALARTLRRPTFIKTPPFALRLALGEAAELLLGGQHACAEKIQTAGHRFAYPQLTDALADCIG